MSTLQNPALSSFSVRRLHIRSIFLESAYRTSSISHHSKRIVGDSNVCGCSGKASQWPANSGSLIQGKGAGRTDLAVNVKKSRRSGAKFGFDLLIWHTDRRAPCARLPRTRCLGPLKHGVVQSLLRCHQHLDCLSRSGNAVNGSQAQCGAVHRVQQRGGEHIARDVVGERTAARGCRTGKTPITA